MRFRAEHEFGGPVDAVTALLVDPAFHRGLELPDLSLLDVVESAADGDLARLRLRYEFVGKLDPIAARLVGGRRLTWLQDLDLDLASGAGRLRFALEAEPKKLHGKAEFTIQPLASDPGRSVRRLAGELIVSVFPIGGMAEGRLVPGLRRRLDIEAAELDRRLATA